MIFPALCVDNFYDNPDQVREFALSLEYKKQLGNYPGLRTDPLYDIDYNFFNTSVSKIVSLFFNYNNENISWEVTTYFQKIYPFSEDKNSLLNSGWYHEDSFDGVAAGVIYLNPNSNLDAGTTIGQLKLNLSESDVCYENMEWRNKLYANEKIDQVKYQQKIIEHNSMFDKTLEFKNVYNRFIFYDASYWHKESNFFADEYEPRLTQVFFIHKIQSSCGMMPIERSKQFYI
jgi:hypothetical protein